ncbi:hypothetical protein BVG16_27290 [Paenibacillus selenitireducens]|uniref:DUF4184 family protein n=1 Tax=Paenibacillus selenitireducens TaxID=1324314 RepID=A0A1T2X1S2_9BACL|nr:hypothetical protein BVG16_27290 [Paenibacillus selenitireducens]
MPFTFAHPLYALPIQWIKPRYVSIAGLVLGSMSPDFEYFLALEPYQLIGHTHKGLLLQALPLCVLIMLLLQIIMKPVALHLPSIFHLDTKSYALIRYFDVRDVTKWVIFLSSVIIGFYSHIFIDSFTHKTGYFVENSTFLQRSYFTLPVYKLLQYSLSIMGVLVQMCLIVMLFMRIPHSALAITKIHWKRKCVYWLIVLITLISLVTLKLIFTSSTNVLGILVVSPISGFLLGIVIASILFRKATINTHELHE